MFRSLLMAVNPTAPSQVRRWHSANAAFVGRVGEKCLLPDGSRAVVVGNDSNGSRPISSCTLRGEDG